MKRNKITPTTGKIRIQRHETTEAQSNSNIVESIIVENSIIVDNLPSTEDFYLIKIQNSRNSKIVELFLGKVA